MSRKKLLIKEWNYTLAEYEYQLIENITDGGFYRELLATGDTEWAKRTAKHFNLKMPEEQS